MAKPINPRPARAILKAAVSSLAIMGATPGALALQSGSAAGQAITISAQPLGQALFAVSDAYGVTVLAPNELVEGLRAPAISGAPTAQDALDQLLAGTGLEARRSGAGRFVIQRASSDRRSSAVTDSATGAADTIVVRGKFQDSLIDRLPVTVRELPFTLNTVDREDIDLRNFVRRIDVLDTLPNIQLGTDFGSSGDPAFFVRGFDAPILVNNRVLNAFRGSGFRDDSFVERYEVLKGPASIALGPIAGGGVINTVTKQPESTDFTDLRFTTDQFGTVNGEFDFNNAALFGSEHISFRISGAYRNFKFDAEEVSREEFAIRPVILADYDKTSARVSFAYKDTQGPAGNFFALFNDGSVPENFDTDTYFGPVNGFQNSKDYFFDGQIVHEFLDNLTLTLRGSHQSSEPSAQNRTGVYNYLYDEGLAGISRDNPVVYTYSSALDQERNIDFVDAQLLYSFDLKGLEQSIVVGGSFNQTDVWAVAFADLDNLSFAVPVDQIDQPRVLNTFSFQEEPIGTDTSESEIISAYAEFVLRPLEDLSIIGGVRYDDFEDSFIRNGEEVRGSTAEDVTFRLGASYEIAPTISTFVSVAESFLPQTGTRRDFSAIGPETARNIEIGLKGTFLEGLLNVDLGAFRTTRSNVSVRDPANQPSDLIVFFVPIGEQRNQGVEATLNLNTENGLDVDLTYGYLDQQLIANLEGGQLPAVPAHQLSVFGTYEVQTGPVAGLTVGGGFRHFGPRTSARVPGFNFPSVTVGDAVVSYPLSEGTSVSMNVLNVTDNLYLENGGTGPGQFSGAQIFGAPRTFVFSVRTRF